MAVVRAAEAIKLPVILQVMASMTMVNGHVTPVCLVVVVVAIVAAAIVAVVVAASIVVMLIVCLCHH